MKRKVYLKLVTLEEARRILFESFGQSPLGREEIALAQARGRTLAEPAAARLSSPPFHGAAMDGVAVAAESTFGASERRPKVLRIGPSAHWVNTGRPLPSGCNAVIMVENLVTGIDFDGVETVTVDKAAFPWQHVRKLGEDLVATEIILPSGVVIGAYEVGALAAAGITRPLVFKKPKVVVIPSGSELVDLEDPDLARLAAGGRLPEFNSLVLSALIEDVGGEPVIYPIVPDDPDQIREAILKAVQSEADLVVVNAGSSAGSRDYTAPVIAELGDLLIHGVSIMPGKPTVLGRVSGKPVLGAPGYPVSAIISFEQLGQPLLARWQNRPAPARLAGEARPFQTLPSRPGLEEFIRVKLGRVNGELVAVPLPRGAGTVSSLSRADGLIRIAAQDEGLSAGLPAPVTLIRSAARIDGALLAIGSHDNTLDLLDSLMRKHKPGYSLTSAHLGSLGGLVALRAGRCHLAGCHLLGADGIYNQAAIAEHLKGVPVQLIRLADREQGLIVPPGNPDGLRDLSDLGRNTKITFINRQRGSGTRVLLDWRLKLIGLDSDDICGYENEEYTHMNVAAAVLSGRVSTGLGVKAAALALGLDFIPIGVEEYDLIIPGQYWEDPRMLSLLEVLRSDEFKKAALALGGYGLERTGELVWSFNG